VKSALLGSVLGLSLGASIAGPLAQSSASSSGWSELPQSPIQRSEVAAAAIGRTVYVAGGIAYPIARPGALEAYDVRARSWALKTPMPEDVNHAAAVGYGGALYVLGGYAGFPENGPVHGFAADETGRFFRYSPGTNSWTELAPMPTRRGALAAAVIGDRLYAVGGYSEALGTLARLEIYDFRSHRWTRGPDMHQPREHLAATALDGSLYVVGGRDFYGGQTYATAERFDPSQGRWEQVPSMLVAHAGFQAVAAGKRIVIFGGEQPGSGARGTVADVEAYDPGTRAWSELPPMPHPRHGIGGAWDGQRIYALEGGEETLLGGSSLAEALAVPVNAEPTPRARPALRLTVHPRRIATGRNAVVHVHVTARSGRGSRPIAGVLIRLLRRAGRTDRHGTTKLHVRLLKRGSYRVVATRRGYRAATAAIRGVRGRAAPRDSEKDTA
jgi:hypothetical protein